MELVTLPRGSLAGVVDLAAALARVAVAAGALAANVVAVELELVAAGAMAVAVMFASKRAASAAGPRMGHLPTCRLQDPDGHGTRSGI